MDEEKEQVFTELKKKVVTYQIESGAEFMTKRVLTYNAVDKEAAEELITKAENESEGRVTYNLKYKKPTKKRDDYYVVDITESFEF